MEYPASKKLKLTEFPEDLNKYGTRDFYTEASHASNDRWEDIRDKGAKEIDVASPHRETQKKLRLTGVIQEANLGGLTMHDSSTFKLQVEQLLRKVQPSYEKRMARVNATLQTLKQVIEELPDHSPLLVAEAEERLSKDYGVRVPFPEPRPSKDVKYTFSYAKPANINVVGSFARHTAIKANDHLTIDLAVTMPSKIFQENDYLNYRYFYKRAYYLARIAGGIKGSKCAHFHINYALQNGNHLQPIILITPIPCEVPCDFTQSKCRIKIILAADGNLFSGARLAPNKSCLLSPGASQKIQHKPTPFYNATLRSECCSFRNLRLLHRASCQSEGFQHACVLGSVWLRQRGFGASLTQGGFGPFEWACTVALLMQGVQNDRPRLSKTYGSYQIFKATLEFLSEERLIQAPAFIGDGMTEVYGNELPMLFDRASGSNLLFKMTPWSYTLLRLEAASSLKLLNDPFADHLDACFIAKVDVPIRRFDCLAIFDLGGYMITGLSPTSDAHSSFTQVCFLVHQVLKRAIDDRAHLVNLTGTTQSLWATSAVQPQSFQDRRLLIGLLLNPQHFNRTVDRGPSAAEKEAAASFRAFWGEKAELRRFNDGSIRESLIWSYPSEQSVLEQLLMHILRRHFGREAADSLSMLTDTFKRIPCGKLNDVAAFHRPMMVAYENLEKRIRALEGMPLDIRIISPADAQLRYTSPKLTEENASAIQSMEPANVLIQFGGSSRWPDELAAVERTKIALLLKIGELLECAGPPPTVSTRLGLEGQTNGLSNQAFLDVSYSSGAFFRLRIYHEREQTLLERALGTASLETTREVAASALSACKREFIQSPLHTQALRTLSSRFPVLPSSICLMKNWCDSQLLSHHIRDELIELLTIRSFVMPYPWAVPGSAVTGFLRTLAFISNWDWRSEPLIIDFSGEMGVAEYDAITIRFEAWRKLDPAMNRIAMFVASNHDPEGMSWTEFRPSKVIATRLTTLARAACSVMKAQGIGLQVAALFSVSLADYDFVLYLNCKAAYEYSTTKPEKKRKLKNLQIQDPQLERALPLMGVNSFLDELRRLYASNVIFFYNESGGLVIGGLWNPQTGPRSWKINVGYSTMAIKGASKDDGQLVLNKAGILHDIANLGGDLILKIEEKGIRNL